MTQAPSVKILVCYHKPDHIFANDILTPIQLGRARAAQIMPGMPGDDSGENISELNHKFCEMTGLYWAWKNYTALGSPDYCGLMHYRRLLYFTDDSMDDMLRVKSHAEVKPEYISAAAIQSMVSRYDICVKSPIGIHIDDPQGQRIHYDVTTQYFTGHGDKYLEKAFICVAEKYPDYIQDILVYGNSFEHYLCNISVMRKDIFFDYAKWMFSILFEMEKIIDYTVPGQDPRAISYLSERLTGLYISRQRRLGSFKIRHLSSVNIDCW